MRRIASVLVILTIVLVGIGFAIDFGKNDLSGITAITSVSVTDKEILIKGFCGFSASTVTDYQSTYSDGVLSLYVKGYDFWPWNPNGLIYYQSVNPSPDMKAIYLVDRKGTHKALLWDNKGTALFRDPLLLQGNGNPIPLAEAEVKIKAYNVAGRSDLKTFIGGGYIKVTELPSEEVWDKMNVQLYSAENPQGTFYFIIDHGKTTCLEGCFDPTIEYVICDLDHNNAYELIYTYQFGSGVNVGVLGAYTEGRILSISDNLSTEKYGFDFWFKFNKSTDQDVTYQVLTRGFTTYETVENVESSEPSTELRTVVTERELASGKFRLTTGKDSQLVLDSF